MDLSEYYIHALQKYKGQKVRVVFISEASFFHDICEGILGDVFHDGFFIAVGKKKPSTRICYLRNVAYVELKD